jgi:hypothetical protein
MLAVSDTSVYQGLQRGSEKIYIGHGFVIGFCLNFFVHIDGGVFISRLAGE